MQLLVQIITDDVLANLRMLLLEIHRLASAVLDAGVAILTSLLGA
jgi:hypothetical protein